MTFGFKAIGSRDEVVAQLKACDDTNYGDLGKAVRDLVVSNLEATSGQAAHSADAWAVKYVVTGNGHGDSNSVSFSLEVHSHWVPQAKPDAVQTPVNTDVPQQAGPDTQS